MVIGTMASQNANAVAITGGSVSGITSLAVGANTLFVDSATNRVGVRTSSPSCTFQMDGGRNEFAGFYSTETAHSASMGINIGNTVSGNAKRNIGSFGVLDATSGQTNYIVYFRNAYDGEMRFQTNGAIDRLNINSTRAHFSTSVGINISSPDAPLHVYSASANTSAIIDASSGDAQVMLKSGGVLRFLFGYEDSDDGFRIYNYGTSSPSMFIKRTTGQVNINTTVSTATLTIKSRNANDTVWDALYSGTSSPLFRLTETGGNESIITQYNSSGASINRFRTNGDNYILGGNFSVGSATAFTKFHVAGSPAQNNTTKETVMLLQRPFNSGVSFGQRAAFLIGRYAADGKSSTQLDINLREAADDATSATMPEINVVTLRSDGKVGLGTSPISRVHVLETTTATTGFNNVITVGLNTSSVSNASNGFGWTIAGNLEASDGNMYGSGSFANYWVDAANRKSGWRWATRNDESIMVFTDTGMGVGTSAPTSSFSRTLHIEGAGSAAITLSNGPSKRFSFGVTGTNGLGFYDETAAAYRMFFTTTGDAGVNTTNPVAKFDVNGSFNAAGNATIGGTLGVTGQTELNGQSAAGPNSAMTNLLTRRVPIDCMHYAMPPQMTISGVSAALSGTGANNSSAQMPALVQCGATLNSYATLRVGQYLTMSYGVRSTVDFSRKLLMSHFFQCSFVGSLCEGNFIWPVGTSYTTGGLTGKGFGWKQVGGSLYGVTHDGTTLRTTSAQTVSHGNNYLIAVFGDGAGNYSFFVNGVLLGTLVGPTGTLTTISNPVIAVSAENKDPAGTGNMYMGAANFDFYSWA